MLIVKFVPDNDMQMEVVLINSKGAIILGQNLHVPLVPGNNKLFSTSEL